MMVGVEAAIVEVGSLEGSGIWVETIAGLGEAEVVVVDAAVG
jgi:hypothetical protein